MGVIIGDSLESYTYGEFKSDQYRSLLKIDEADNATPPLCNAQPGLKLITMITRA